MNHISKTAVAGLRSSAAGVAGRVQTGQVRSATPPTSKQQISSQAQASKPADLTVSSQVDPAVPHDAPIPKNALRLRIIANSDSAADQQLKREVRNAVVVQVAKLIKGATTEAQAQKIVTNHLPSLKSLAVQVVHQHGFRYDVKAKVGKVPFPTKVYGNRVYPAGNYKALRFILGKGQGKNWWCVLFPPLCFVDIADGDAVPNTGGFPDLPPLETITVPNLQGKPTKVAVRLASVDYGEELWKTVKQWF
ncbi:stage II sporulation protein R [Alicyclobacillus sp. SO9]|nr:stage II sporulation protein R [Alicyclobacillus sp. SO9]